MPFVDTRVSCSVSKEQEERLKQGYSDAIRCLRGKTEDYLMLSFTDRAHLWLAGDNGAPTAMVEVSVFGDVVHEDCCELTYRITALLEQVLGIHGSRIYVKYTTTPEWGWNGAQF